MVLVWALDQVVSLLMQQCSTEGVVEEWEIWALEVSIYNVWFSFNSFNIKNVSAHYNYCHVQEWMEWGLVTWEVAWEAVN